MEADRLNKLLALIERELDVRVTAETYLDSLAIDSLDFASLLQSIRSEIGPITTKAATDANTVGELAGAIAA